MLPIYTPEEARRTILRRQPPDDLPVPPELRARLQELFGEPLSPAQAVERILADVRREGDEALRRWSERLDGAAPEPLRVPAAEISAALDALDPELRAALEESIRRVGDFHRRQPAASWIQQEGGTLGQLLRPIRRVGLYVPAGTAPLPSTVIMSAVPAQVAGVQEIAVVSPPERASGKVSPLVLAACALLGIDEVYALGGAQAVAALAYGTPSVPAVDKICGPGNLFVTLAKRQVYGLVGIDSLAGPTETVVIADAGADPCRVAADLLAQAEHDWQAAAVLLTPSPELARAAAAEVARQAQTLSRRESVTVSLANRGGAVVTADVEEALALSNAFGPEHLCLAVADPWRWLEQVTSAGGVFLGEDSCEVLGDYIAGPSHVMPTSGSARFASPLNVWDFLRVISLVALDGPTAARVAPLAARIARAEGLDGHACAADLRAGQEV